MATFAYVRYAHRKRSRRGRARPFVSKLPLAGDWVRQPKFLHSGMSRGGLFAAISLELWRALRLCGIADRLSQHLAQLRLCLCRFSFGWLPLSHASYVGMLGEIKPLLKQRVSHGTAGGAHVGNIGMYYAAYRLSQQCWNVTPTGRNAGRGPPHLWRERPHLQRPSSHSALKTQPRPARQNA